VSAGLRSASEGGDGCNRSYDGHHGVGRCEPHGQPDKTLTPEGRGLIATTIQFVEVEGTPSPTFGAASSMRRMSSSSGRLRKSS
jgi:hypothetical protein